MSRRFVVSVTCAVLAASLVAGCGSGVRRTLGLEKRVPDEFAVVSRAPLTVPPDFKLRPPQPGAERPQEGSTADMARTALTGNPNGAFAGRGMSQGEQALLTDAGASQAVPGIRDVVNRETSVLAEEEKSFTDRLVFWREDEPTGTLIDAEAEAKRIRQNQALGKSMTEGDSPQIERRQRGLLEGIF